MLQEKYEENIRDYAHKVRSCLDVHTGKYFILSRIGNVWMYLNESYTVDRAKHMVQFNILVETIKNED